MSGTLDSDSGPPSPGGPPGPPSPGGPPGGPGGAPGGPMMPGGPPPGFPRPGMRPSMPGQGTAAGGLSKILHAIRMIQMAMVELPIGSEAHKDALKASEMLSKHVAPQKENEGITTTGVSQLLQMLAKNAMAGRAGAAQGQGRPGMSPMTPLPGA